MKQLYNNKKGGIGQEWIFALATMFGLTVLVLTFNVVFFEDLAPVLIDALPEGEVGVQAEAGINNFLDIWKFLPYIILGMIMVFLFVISIKKEPIERQF